MSCRECRTHKSGSSSLDVCYARIHTGLVTGGRPGRETARVRVHAGTKRRERQRLLLGLFHVPGPNSPTLWLGEVTMKGEGENGEKKTEKRREERGMERSIKRDLFEQAPGLSRGRGRAVSTTLPSVKQTDGEREGEREV